MKKIYDYTQGIKKDARHLSLFHAVQLLTTDRSNACCVKRSYVRNVYDYFKSYAYDKTLMEVDFIDISYINAWEKLHDSCVNFKRPEDLSVCYLSGPQPKNDFEELVSLGILPQNIWAFENDNATYQQALNSYNDGYFPQPKIVKTSIQQFFKSTPKKFDIIYIDACGALISDQKCLQIIATIFKYHRLSSIGVLVTNFSVVDVSRDEALDIYSDIISLYKLFKQHQAISITFNDDGLNSKEFLNIKRQTCDDFSTAYGDFITNIIKDTASIITPALRFSNAIYIHSILKSSPSEALKNPFYITDLNKINNNSLYKFFMLSELMCSSDKTNENIKFRLRKLNEEFLGLDNISINVFDSLRLIQMMKNNTIPLKDEIVELKEFFDTDKYIYQFLDKPNSNLFFDLIINQLSYPMHYNTESIKRFKYVAKSTEMYMDVIAFDECRYIYEWLPTIHQVKSAFLNRSWQYVFRFALDGLVKHRIGYNNEYFFQGSVVPKSVNGFSSKVIDPRIIIN